MQELDAYGVFMDMQHSLPFKRKEGRSTFSWLCPLCLRPHQESPEAKAGKGYGKVWKSIISEEKRIENTNRQTDAESLLHLSTVGNDTEYCEPHTGTCAMTDMTIAELEEMEADRQKRLMCNQDMMKENEQLKMGELKVDFWMCCCKGWIQEFERRMWAIEEATNNTELLYWRIFSRWQSEGEILHGIT